MRTFRFNHVYGLLLLFCAATTFIPLRFVDPARAQVQNIYAPIMRPALAMAQWIHARFDRRRIPDAASPETPRSDSDIRQENLELRDTVAGLTSQLQKLEAEEGEYQKLGPLRDSCTRYTVAAGDSGTGESLLIGGGNFAGLKPDMAAVYAGGLAGRLQTPGLTGTRVRLITDRGFSLSGVFVRFVKRTDGHIIPVRIATDPVLVRGEGSNSLLIDSVPLAKVEEIHVNDWVVLEDSDRWQNAVQGQLVGRVIATPAGSRRSPGFAEIHLEPAVHLMQLHELMIVDKAK